jgi:hypothetical protein
MRRGSDLTAVVVAVGVVIAMTCSMAIVGLNVFGKLAEAAPASTLATPGVRADPAVVFIAPGCPPGAHWGVKLGLVTKVGNGPGPLTFPVAYGTYSWSLVPPQPANFALGPPSGSVTLSPLAGPSVVTVTLSCTAASGVVNLNGTPIVAPNGTVIGTLNGSTSHPWGEAYDPVNGCLYVTEDPMTTPATQGFLTSFGTFQPPTSVTIPGGLNPQGIAWSASYYGEPAIWKAIYHDGVVLIADTGSNAVSLFGLGLPGAVTCHPTFLGTDSFVPNWATGALLNSPWDVTYDPHSMLFYVTWDMVSGVVGAFSGLSPGCEFLTGTADPNGLSVDRAGALEVANDVAIGWVTGLTTTPVLDSVPGPCTGAAVGSLPAELDQPTFTAYATLVIGNGSTKAFGIIGASDSGYGVPPDLIGPGVPPACLSGPPPANHILAELQDPTLACKNAVSVDPATPPPASPGAYGLAYNSYTHHFLEVLNAAGEVEAVDYTFAFPAIHVAPAAAFQSVEVIWFVPTATFLHPYYFNAPVGDGTMAITNWAAGTIFLGAAV